MVATSESWKNEPFGEGVSLPYHAIFTDEQFARLKQGLIPRAMEDKWFIYYEEPYLFFHRSWTGKPVYRLALGSVPSGIGVIEASWSKDMADDSKFDLGYQVQLVDFLVSNLLLGEAKPFPLPQGVVEPMKGLLQHSVAGTGYPESSTKPKSK